MKSEHLIESTLLFDKGTLNHVPRKLKRNNLFEFSRKLVNFTQFELCNQGTSQLRTTYVNFKSVLHRKALLHKYDDPSVSTE
jgi:hypothetical protein